MRIGLVMSCAVIASLAVGACAEDRAEDGVAVAAQSLTTVSSNGVTATLNTTSDWGNGFCDTIDIKNTGAVTSDWTVTLTGVAPLNTIWNAVQTTSGNTMTLKPSGNSRIETGAPLQIGFCGTGTVRPTLASITVTRSGAGTGGASGTGGAQSTGGVRSTGGSSSAGGGVSCSATPLTGGITHCSSSMGRVGPYTWNLWSNAGGACLTTYGTGAAFKASWRNSGDMLARVGLQWDQTKYYNQLGTISADYSYKKSGTGGPYSYIGFYGWSADPCVEYYIIDDSYGAMPVKPFSATERGSATIDGATYKLYSSVASGVGGARCSGVSTWSQFYSVRQTARQCGHVSVTQHFRSWASAGMNLGKMIEGGLCTETGGGTGSIDYAAASVTAQ